MHKDGLRDSILFQLSKNIECFWDFTEDMIIDPGIHVSEIKKSVEKRYSELKWSDQRDGVYFGFVPCDKKVGHRFTVEVNLFEKPCSIRISGGYATDVKAIAQELNMMAFDVLNGNRIYP